MKKKISIVVSLLLCISVLRVYSIIPGQARVSDSALYGDVNMDYDVAIDDVTRIQRYLLSMTSFDGLQKELADYDRDGDVTIKDATLIQRKLAELPVPEVCGGWIEYTADAKKCYADYSSGKAMVGVPVTFTMEGGYPYDKYEPDDFFKPITYTYSIYQYEYSDGHSQRIDIAKETVVDAPLTYTFDKAGTYTVNCLSCDRLENQSEYSCTYTVVDPYSTEKPVIASIYSDKLQTTYLFDGAHFLPSRAWKDMTLYINAVGGSGIYEYAFELTAKDKIVKQDFSAANSFTIDSAYFPGWDEYNAIKEENNAHWDDKTYQRKYYDWREVDSFTLMISVRDSNGDITTETISIEPIRDFDYVG